MPTPLLTTKLYIPPPRRDALARPNLIANLNLGLDSNRQLTVISAAAGFGKTTLASQWANACGRPVAWVSLDKGDSDPVGFLTYLVAAIRTVTPIGEELLTALQAPHPPPIESIMIGLLNELAEIQVNMMIVLDDYHLIDAGPVDDALSFLLDHLPPSVHLVIVTHEDPHLPLARWRARGMLAEMQANDLRLSPTESSGFLAGAMGLRLSPDDVTTLQCRTEGWIGKAQSGDRQDFPLG